MKASVLLDLCSFGVDGGIGVIILEGVEGALVVLHVAHILHLNSGS
jgi:hypothetical protein